MFWAIFEILKPLLRVFIRVSGSFTDFIDFVAYFKALMHFLKPQFGNCEL